MANRSWRIHHTLTVLLLLFASTSLPAGEPVTEAQLFERACGQCHTSSRIFLVRLDPAKRRHVVDHMRDRWEGGSYALPEEDVQRLLGTATDQIMEVDEGRAGAWHGSFHLPALNFSQAIDMSELSFSDGFVTLPMAFRGSAPAVRTARGSLNGASRVRAQLMSASGSSAPLGTTRAAS